MIGDPELSISKAWGMLPATANGDASKRSGSDNQTVRNVFVISPDKKIQLILVYPMTMGRNFDEVLRAIDSLEFTVKHKVATPVNWKPGEDVIIVSSVTDEAARKAYLECGGPDALTFASCRNRAGEPHGAGRDLSSGDLS